MLVLCIGSMQSRSIRSRRFVNERVTLYKFGIGIGNHCVCPSYFTDLFSRVTDILPCYKLGLCTGLY